MKNTLRMYYLYALYLCFFCRAAIYAAGNGDMSVDEAVAAYGSLPEE